jgi:hypothetical protein
MWFQAVAYHRADAAACDRERIAARDHERNRSPDGALTVAADAE